MTRKRKYFKVSKEYNMQASPKAYDYPNEN